MFFIANLSKKTRPVTALLLSLRYDQSSQVFFNKKQIKSFIWYLSSKSF